MIALILCSALSTYYAPAQAQALSESNSDWKMQWREFKQNMPPKPELGEFMKNLDVIATLTDVEILDVTKQLPRQKDGYQEIPFFVRIQGNYDNVSPHYLYHPHRKGAFTTADGRF